jgi:hypothetical protein
VGYVDVQYEFNTYSDISGYMQIINRGVEVVNTLSGSLNSGTFYTSGSCTTGSAQTINVFNTSNDPNSAVVLGYEFNGSGVINGGYSVVNYSGSTTGTTWSICADGISPSEDLLIYGFTTSSIPIYSYTVSNASSTSSNMLCSGSISNTIQSTGSTLNVGSDITININNSLNTGGIGSLPGSSYGVTNYISDGIHIYGYTPKGQMGTIISKTPCS